MRFLSRVRLFALVVHVDDSAYQGIAIAVSDKDPDLSSPNRYFLSERRTIDELEYVVTIAFTQPRAKLMLLWQAVVVLVIQYVRAQKVKDYPVRHGGQLVVFED